ncbi:MAG: pitrilysin family protein [Armatimonadota bacterium]|nr:insulinase family protein [bacterium]
MTRIFTFAALFLIAFQSIASAQGSPIKVTRMGNGLTVILQEDHAVELVGIDIWVKAGSATETPALNGISHLIEHLVFGSTNKHKAGELDLEMESLGTTLDARTSRDWAHFSATVSTRYLSRALDALAEVVTGALFDDQELDRERLVIVDEIAKKQVQPIEVCRDYLAQALYGEHPYSLPIEGTADSVSKITRKDVLDHYHKFYVPDNMAVALVGDIDPQQAVAEIGRAFQLLPNSPAPQQAVSEIIPPASLVEKKIEAPYSHDYLGIAFLGPRGSDYADVCAIDTLMTYLGFGYRNWMHDELANRMGLATDTSADFLTQKYPAMISLVAGITNGSLEKAKSAIFAEIARISQQGIPDASLALAQRQLLGEYAFQNETYGGRANTAGFYFAVSDPQFASQYIACLQAVTNQDIIRVAQKYLDPQHAVIVIVGPNQGGTR